MSRQNVGKLIREYLEGNPDVEIMRVATEGTKDKIQTVEMEIYPSERMLTGMLNQVITGVSLEGSRAVTPPPERREADLKKMEADLKIMEKIKGKQEAELKANRIEIEANRIEMEADLKQIKGKVTNEEGGNATPPPLFKSEEAQTDIQARTATESDGSSSPPVCVTPPPPTGPPQPRTPAAASTMEEFINELKELAAWSNVEGVYKSKEERRDKKEQLVLKFWKKLLLNIHCEAFANLAGEPEGTPSGALQFYVLQCQEYLKTKRLDWPRHMMRRGMMVHVDRLVEAERMNNVVKDTRVFDGTFIHSQRCEKYLNTIKKMERATEELRKKLQTEICKKQELRKHYESALFEKVCHEKYQNSAKMAAMEEFQVRQEKMITALQIQLENSEQENKEQKEEIIALRDETEGVLSALSKPEEQERTYSIMGFKIIFPF